MKKRKDTTTTTTANVVKRSDKRDLEASVVRNISGKRDLESSNVKKLKRDFKDTISLTFGDRAENHAGMQILGKLADSGFTHKDLLNMSNEFEKKGCKCELVKLNELLPPSTTESEDAYFLIIRDGLAKLVDNEKAADKLYKEQRKLDFDKKAKMRGRVVNKRARWNLCFDKNSQEPDYHMGKGRVVAFSDCPKLNYVRHKLPLLLGPKAKNLCAELNMYYDLSKCGIGFHGDSERRIVVCVRLGASMPMDFQWFQRSLPVGKRFNFTAHHGDIYAMSEKATGFDWKRRSILTLRHAAGCKKFRTIVVKKKSDN